MRLAEEGANIIAVDVCKQLDGVPIPMSTPEDLEETVALVEKAGGKIHAAQADVRDMAAMQVIVDDGVAQFGRLDIICANAGLASSGDRLDALDEKGWRDMIDVNLTGVWATTRVSVPHMRKAGNGGSIILTSSVGGLRALPSVGHYVSAKHGMIGIMRTLAMELGEESIRVNAICPTQVSTPMLLNESTFKMFRPDLENPTQEDFAPLSQMMHVLPTPWVDAIDISNAVLFLASEESRFITGVSLPVDAGAMLK